MTAEIIQWARNAASTAQSLERLLGLAEVMKLDKHDNHAYTNDPAFDSVRKAWAARFTELGGNLKSPEVKDPTAFLDTLLGKNADGINLTRFSSKTLRTQEPAYTPVRKPKPAARKRPTGTGQRTAELFAD